MIIGDNVKIKNHPFFLLANKPYIGQVGVIIAIPKPKQYRVRFVDDYEAVFFEKELISLWSEQKRMCQEDFFKTDNQVEQARLKAGIILCL